MHLNRTCSRASSAICFIVVNVMILGALSSPGQTQRPASREHGKSTNSLFDDSEAKSFAVDTIAVEGEVENPGQVDLRSLPLQSVLIKELGTENGKQTFKGAFLVTGYALYDILNELRVKKIATNTFSPPIDLYVIVQNDRGSKAVFSWGEIYYTPDRSNVLLSKTVRAINPAHAKIEWPLPTEPRLVCGNDMLNTRFVSNPTKITILSYHGTFATEKPKDIYSSEIRIVLGGAVTAVSQIGSNVENRKHSGVGYGHGSGYKGVQNLTGYLLKDLIGPEKTVDYFSDGIVVASAKDGYRSVFSVSEILNRNDDRDFLLIDKKDSSSDGRYVLFAPGDFFADRDVKAVEKLEFVRVQ